MGFVIIAIVMLLAIYSSIIDISDETIINLFSESDQQHIREVMKLYLINLLKLITS